MPWMSIIVWLVSFLLSKSKGASTAKAAGIASLAGLATYYLVDPANPDAMFDIGLGSKTTPGDPNDDNGTSANNSLFGRAISEVGSTLRSWGPTGTLGVIAGTTALTTDFKKYLPWVLGGLGLILIMR